MTKPLNTVLCTLNYIIQKLNADSSSINVSTTAGQTTQINTESANFQAQMKDDIRTASDMIVDATNNSFVPYLHTHTLTGYAYKKWWCFDDALYAYILSLPDNLLSVTSLTFAGTAMSASGYYLRPEGYYPAYEIAIHHDTVFTLPSATTETIALVGIWGYHPDPDNMWADSGDAVGDNPLSASATTLNVTSGNNFEIYQYIRIESEYLLITAISSNALTVERGVLGTTAASHAQTTQIDTYQPIKAIQDECARLAIRNYLLRNGINIVSTGETAFDLTIGKVNLARKYFNPWSGSA